MLHFSVQMKLITFFVFAPLQDKSRIYTDLLAQLFSMRFARFRRSISRPWCNKPSTSSTGVCYSVVRKSKSEDIRMTFQRYQMCHAGYGAVCKSKRRRSVRHHAGRGIFCCRRLLAQVKKFANYIDSLRICVQQPPRAES